MTKKKYRMVSALPDFLCCSDIWNTFCAEITETNEGVFSMSLVFSQWVGLIILAGQVIA